MLMKHLQKTCCILRIDELAELTNYYEKPVVSITFDDGYLDFMENVLPILLELGIPACHNICPSVVDNGIPPWTQVLSACLVNCSDSHLEMPDGTLLKIPKPVTEASFLGICELLYGIDDEIRMKWIDEFRASLSEIKMSPMMNWEDVNKCQKEGILIGSHGYAHRNLSQLEDIELLEHEIGGSRQKILNETGHAPVVFAFPNGLYSPLSIEVVEKCGYDITLLCGDATACLDNFTDSGRLKSFPRINIGRSNWREESLRASGFHYRIKKKSFTLN